MMITSNSHPIDSLKASLKRAAVFCPLFVLLFSSTIHSAPVTLAWKPVTKNTDGSSLKNLAGYRLFVSTESFMSLTPSQALSDSRVLKIDLPIVHTHSLSLIEDNTYFFKLTALDSDRIQSAFNLDLNGQSVLVSTYLAGNRNNVPEEKAEYTTVHLIHDPVNLGMIIIAVRAADPAFTGVILRMVLDLQSGKRVLDLDQLPEDPALYYKRVATSTLTQADFTLLEGRDIPIQLGLQVVDAKGVEGMVIPSFGARIEEESGGPVVVFMPGSVSQEVKLDIQREPASLQERMNLALGSQDLIALGEGWDFILTPANPGTLTALVSLSFDRSLIPAGMDISSVRIAYFNPTKGEWGEWEIVDNVKIIGNIVEANVTHFSIYKVVLMAPASQAGLSEAYIFPNPSVSPAEPTIRVKMGLMDQVNITIYDLSGQKVHSASLDGNSVGVLNGDYCYEYTWSASKPSGIYFAVIQGKKSSGTTTVTAKFAVVR